MGGVKRYGRSAFDGSIVPKDDGEFVKLDDYKRQLDAFHNMRIAYGMAKERADNAERYLSDAVEGMESIADICVIDTNDVAPKEMAAEIRCYLLQMEQEAAKAEVDCDKMRERAEKAERERDEEREKVEALVWYARKGQHQGYHVEIHGTDWYVCAHMGTDKEWMELGFNSYATACLAAHRHWKDAQSRQKYRAAAE